MRLQILSTLALAAANAILATPLSEPSPFTNVTIHSRAPPNKRGLIYDQASASLPLFHLPNSKITWSSNWQAWPASCSFPFVPMLHDLRPLKITEWKYNIDARLAEGSTHVLFINEPDMWTQQGGSESSPQAAADAYRQYLMPYKNRAYLGTPAVTSAWPGSVGPHGPMGLAWLEQFLNACQGCSFDFIAFHFFGESIEELKTHVQAVYNLAMRFPSVKKENGKPKLWLTEFAQNNERWNSPERIASWLREVLPWLDAADIVERYAYWWVENGSLLTDGKPNVAGITYATY